VILGSRQAASTGRSALWRPGNRPQERREATFNLVAKEAQELGKLVLRMKLGETGRHVLWPDQTDSRRLSPSVMNKINIPVFCSKAFALWFVQEFEPRVPFVNLGVTS
jgi:hypothetical protein